MEAYEYTLKEYIEHRKNEEIKAIQQIDEIMNKSGGYKKTPCSGVCGKNEDKKCDTWYLHRKWDDIAIFHKTRVIQALANGIRVDSKILVDYPDI